MIFVGGSVVDPSETRSSPSQVPSLLFFVFFCFFSKHDFVWIMVSSTKTPTSLFCSIPIQEPRLLDGLFCCEGVCENVAQSYERKVFKFDIRCFHNPIASIRIIFFHVMVWFVTYGFWLMILSAKGRGGHILKVIMLVLHVDVFAYWFLLLGCVSKGFWESWIMGFLPEWNLYDHLWCWVAHRLENLCLSTGRWSSDGLVGTPCSGIFFTFIQSYPREEVFSFRAGWFRGINSEQMCLRVPERVCNCWPWARGCKFVLVFA